MPEVGPSHQEEGWGVRAGAGLVLTAALYGLAFLGTGAAALLFVLYFHTKPERPVPKVFPAPQLNGRIDRDPTWSYAPKSQAPGGIDHAMRSLAAKGEAGWAGSPSSPSEGAKR